MRPKKKAERPGWRRTIGWNWGRGAGGHASEDGDQAPDGLYFVLRFYSIASGRNILSCCTWFLHAPGIPLTICKCLRVGDIVLPTNLSAISITTKYPWHGDFVFQLCATNVIVGRCEKEKRAPGSELCSHDSCGHVFTLSRLIIGCPVCELSGKQSSKLPC